FIVCHVAGHEFFGRDNENLTVRVPVTFAEAALGADIEVPTITGDTVTLRIKPGTQSGARYRVKGRGIATQKNQGDLIVTVDVLVPTSLSDEERALIEKLGAISNSEPRHKWKRPTGGGAA
ncbi:MAG: molecular chaperone DnaJ, partial [Actinomycetota bacterium]